MPPNHDINIQKFCTRNQNYWYLPGITCQVSGELPYLDIPQN